jgi:DNA invertase Pin-like site-specific DNA recombinase
MKGKTVALYARVSSKSQDTASQEPDLKRLADAHVADGYVVHWYKDTFTGKSMERPGWSKLEADIKAGKVGTVIVWRLDRLGRTAKGLTALFDDLRELKVNVISVRDGLDLSTPAGRLMANVLASVAQYETEVRSERQIAGIAVAKDKGTRFGRPEGPGKRVKVTPEQEHAIVRMKGEGAKVAAIGRTTGLSRPTIYSVLKTVASAG